MEHAIATATATETKVDNTLLIMPGHLSAVMTMHHTRIKCSLTLTIWSELPMLLI